MFKPTNPKFDILIAKLKEFRDKKHNIDNEISEMPFIYSEIDDLQKEIEKINSEFAALAKEREEKSQKLSELKFKLDRMNKIELQENSVLIEKEIKKKEEEIQKIIDEDFKSFIETMTEENTMSYYLSSDTSTTPIMDEFYNNNDKDFLVLKGIFSGKDLVITKKQRNVSVLDIPSPTMTELKTFRPSRIPDRMRPLWDTISKYDTSKMKVGQKVQFDIPLPLGGQTYANQTGYGWEWDWSDGYGSYTEGTYYGEVTTFLIIGFVKNW